MVIDVQYIDIEDTTPLKVSVDNVEIEEVEVVEEVSTPSGKATNVEKKVEENKEK